MRVGRLVIFQRKYSFVHNGNCHFNILLRNSFHRNCLFGFASGFLGRSDRYRQTCSRLLHEQRNETVTDGKRNATVIEAAEQRSRYVYVGHVAFFLLFPQN